MHSFTFAVNRLFCEPNDPLDEFDPYDWEFWDEVETAFHAYMAQYVHNWECFGTAIDLVADRHLNSSQAIHTSISEAIHECGCMDEDDEWYIDKFNLFMCGPGTTFMPGVTIDEMLEYQHDEQVTSDTYAREHFEYTG